MKEKLYAIFEVKNNRATQTSAAFPHPIAKGLYERLQSSNNANDFDTKLEIRHVGA